MSVRWVIWMWRARCTRGLYMRPLPQGNIGTWIGHHTGRDAACSRCPTFRMGPRWQGDYWGSKSRAEGEFIAAQGYQTQLHLAPVHEEILTLSISRQPPSVTSIIPYGRADSRSYVYGTRLDTVPHSLEIDWSHYLLEPGFHVLSRR
jgi:hypothetical protein